MASSLTYYFLVFHGTMARDYRLNCRHFFPLYSFRQKEIINSLLLFYFFIYLFFSTKKKRKKKKLHWENWKGSGKLRHTICLSYVPLFGNMNFKALNVTWNMICQPYSNMIYIFFSLSFFFWQRNHIYYVRIFIFFKIWCNNFATG